MGTGYEAQRLELCYYTVIQFEYITTYKTRGLRRWPQDPREEKRENEKEFNQVKSNNYSLLNPKVRNVCNRRKQVDSVLKISEP